MIRHSIQLTEDELIELVPALLDIAGRKAARTIRQRLDVGRRVGRMIAPVSEPLLRADIIREIGRGLDLPAT